MAHRCGADGVHVRLLCCFCPMRRMPRSSRSALRRRRRAAAATPPNRVTVDVRVPETSPAIEIDVRGPQTRGWLETTLAPVARFGEGYYDVLLLTEGPGQDRYARPLWLLALLADASPSPGSRRVRFNINEFSMHHFYKNRLVRCYLGRQQELEAEAQPADRFRSGRRLSDFGAAPGCRPARITGRMPS